MTTSARNEHESLVEVRLTDTGPFLVVLETLTRIGIPSYTKNTLYQTCHIICKDERYFIAHFKELFALDGLETTLQEADLSRRNWIITTLERWKLVEIPASEQAKVRTPTPKSDGLKVIRHANKSRWRFQAKYTVRAKSTELAEAERLPEGVGIPAHGGQPDPGVAGAAV